jgi:cation diffusion facilitator family transporter
MKKLLIRLFIKNPEDILQGAVRQQYGLLSSVVGIIVNILLFAAKFTVGTLFHSISVTADALNNLSDAGSSVISLVSFKLSARPADKSHPYGHARIEYIASSIVAALILVVGFELGKSSVEKIQNPGLIEFRLITVIILVLSIGVKFWLYTFNHSLGVKIHSTLMQSTAADSLSDVMATSAVLISTLLSPLINFQLDGYIGLIVAMMILYSGYKVMKHTVDRILGQGPSGELVKLIDGFIKKYKGVINIHDLMVHDYGPNRTFASVHVEVDAKVDILISHDLIDNIEKDIQSAYQINLTIHLDPVVMDDPYVDKLRELTAQVIAGIDPNLTFHDFRVVKGQTHSNLIFDVMIPFSYKIKKTELMEAIQNGLRKQDPNLWAVIRIDNILT